MQAARIFHRTSMAVNRRARDTGHDPPARRTQAERSAATRAALVAAARDLFTRDGYAATGREAIVARAGVTRGALYHHFANKQALFSAVFETLEVDVMASVSRAAAGAPSPLEMLRTGALAYLDAALDPGVQRVCLLDAPAVLSMDERAEIVEAHALGVVREVLRAAMADGSIERQPVEPLAHLVVAALHEAALFVARADDQNRAREEVGATMDRLLAGLRTPPRRVAGEPGSSRCGP
jgi:AcrR family transcriptional regulator